MTVVRFRDVGLMLKRMANGCRRSLLFGANRSAFLTFTNGTTEAGLRDLRSDGVSIGFRSFGVGKIPSAQREGADKRQTETSELRPLRNSVLASRGEGAPPCALGPEGEGSPSGQGV